jgi:hypothetical protein
MKGRSPNRAVGTCVLVLAALLLLNGSSASAGNPWQLHCGSTPAERPLPLPLQKTALRFFPWVHSPMGLRAGPVYLVALSSRTRISRDGDQRDSANYYLHRAFVAVAPSYTGGLTISGRRLGKSGRRTTLGFSTNGATRCTVKSPVVSCSSRPLRFANALRISSGSEWRIVRTELRIGRTGCFRIDINGQSLRGSIPLAVPGPDYGTSGW